MHPAPRSNGPRATARYSLLLMLSLAACAYGLAPASRLPRWLRAPSASAAATYTVTTNADGGAGSFRQAITDANANAGTDNINFNLPPGQLTITLLSDLPVVGDPVVIDGTTQPGYSGTPVVEINGNGPGRTNMARSGLLITAGSSVVRGLVLNRFSRISTAAVTLRAAGGNVVENCYVGVDPTGTLARPNDLGVEVTSPQNRIGGTSPAQRNVISGNGGAGIYVAAGDGNVIQGNYVGTNAAGTAAVGNLVGLNGPLTGALVGGTTPGAGNLISGNSGGGVNAGGGGVTIQGNLIGTDAAGTRAVPNGDRGVLTGRGDNRIGGTEPGARNVISGNFAAGVEIGGEGTNNVVEGNYIGVGADGATPLPNSAPAAVTSRGGVLVRYASHNRIGGTAPGAGNVIAFNGGGGVILIPVGFEFPQQGNSVRGNSVFSNDGLGIDLQGDGVTPNDANDADAGANNRQNFPVITSHTSDGSTTAISGTLHTRPFTAYDVDFYSNRACDASGHGEGARHLGSTRVTTGVAGDAAFQASLPGALAAGLAVTATATDASGNTSEFSPCDSSRAAGHAHFERPSLRAVEDVGALTFTVVRAGGAAGTITVNYAAVAGTATEGADYLPAQGTLTFAPGETRKTFTVQIVNDAVAEIDEETVELRLTSADGPEALGAPAVMTLVLLDRSRTPELSVAPLRFAEGDAGTSSAEVPVTLSAATGRTVTVNYETAAGLTSPATPGVDYHDARGTLTFAPGETQKSAPVPVVGDAADEEDETFRVVLLNAVNAPVAAGSSTVTIADDDAEPTISIGDVTVTEGTGGTTVATFPVTLSATSGRRMFFTYSFTGVTALPNIDYTPPDASISTAIEPGQTLTSISVPVVADALDEPDEFFLLNVTFAQNVSFADSVGTATILDDDPTPAVSIHNVSRLEDLNSAATFFVTLSGASALPVSVEYATSDGTAAAGSDYEAASGTLTFAPGEMVKGIAVPVTYDDAVEPDETFFVRLSNPKNATIAAGTGAALILNDDRTIQYGAAAFSASEGDRRALVTVTRTGYLGAADDVTYGTVDDASAAPCASVTGAALARCDYATTIDTLTFAPGEAQKTFAVPLVDDSHAEGAETFQVFILPPSVFGAGPRATVSIADNEAGASGPNPIDAHAFFVRQHYLDFLSREPEAGEPWTRVLDGCPNAFNTDRNSPSARCDRNTVSSAFFRSPEFEFKGLYVFRFYAATLQRLPLYREIIRDMRLVTGETPEEVFRKRAAFADEWARREEFAGLIRADGPGVFVFALMSRAQLTQVTTPDPADPEGGRKVVLTTQQLADRLTAGALTYGQVVRAIADSDEVRAREFNRAFVAMQYFGYLRRDPEEPGFNAWLNHLNANPQDFRTMVDGFVNSVEYRLRFGPR